MPTRPRRSGMLARWLVTIGAYLAIVAQLSVALASVGDARDQSAGVHVEQAGTSLHYAHSDTCGICQAQSLHGLAARTAEPVPRIAAGSAAPVSGEDQLFVAELFSPKSSRAPPSRS